MPRPYFKNRTEAGQRLALAVAQRDYSNVLVCALPRGGVPVAIEIARRLNAPLDLILVRKLGLPGHPELAFGAVIDGDSPQTVINEDIVRSARLSQLDISRVRIRELAEIERRRGLYFRGRKHASPAGRTCVVVDDGLATGATAKVALNSLRSAGAGRVVLAIPVAPHETLEQMQDEADDIICLHVPQHFESVGAAYEAFPQLTDLDVLNALRATDAPPNPLSANA